MHCGAAPCLDAAADGAVYRREDGIVLIDPRKAEGQRSMVDACPYNVIFWNAELQLPQKCTLCAHRLDEGAKEPRCVEACPTGALVFGDLDDPDSEIARLSAVAGGGRLPSRVRHRSDGQRTWVIPKRFIAGEVVRRDLPGRMRARSADHSRGGRNRAGDATPTATATSNSKAWRRIGPITSASNMTATSPKALDVVTHTDVNLGEIILEPLSSASHYAGKVS